jgi:hypothetical protein
LAGLLVADIRVGGLGGDAVLVDEFHRVEDVAAAAFVAVGAAAVDDLLHGEQLQGFSSDE